MCVYQCPAFYMDAEQLNSVLQVCTSAVTHRVIPQPATFSFILYFKFCYAGIKLREVHLFSNNRGRVCFSLLFPFSYTFLFLQPTQSKGWTSLLLSAAQPPETLLCYLTTGLYPFPFQSTFNKNSHIFATINPIYASFIYPFLHVPTSSLATQH